MAKSNKKSTTENLKNKNINESTNINKKDKDVTKKRKRNKSIERKILDNRKNKVKEEEIDVDVINPKLNTKLFNFSKKFDNLKIKYKKNPKLFIAMIICLVFAGFSLIGSSYALLTYISKTGKVTTINAGTLALDFYNESDAISLDDALPQQDNDALEKNSEYTFTLKNNGSLNANYVITLNNTCSTSKSYTINGSSVTPTKCIPDDYIKVGIKEDDKDYKVISKKDNKFIIDSGVVKANNTKTYKMKIWLDWNTPNDYNATGNQVIIYSGKLGLEYEQGSKPNLDKSGANTPELTDNMIPVYYDESSSSWKKADLNNENKSYKWYDYNNKMWANAVTVTSANRSTYLSAEAGTTIPMDDINTMWVWIPRYTYTYLNTNTPEEINIKFEKGTESTGTIKCTDNVSGRGTTSQTCTDNKNGSLKAGTSTYTHPAFTFGDKELTGLWVGKFESSATSILKSESTAESTVIIKPNVQTLRYKRLSYFFRDARQMEKANNVYGFPQSSSTTFNWNGELTGDTNNIDIHMMKNTEWGAVTYLYHSKYGRCTNGTCEELTINNCNNYITGIGADTVSASSSSATCTTDKNKYNGESGVKASTTGNIYGVYDMSGGSHKYTMGNMVDESNLFNASSASNWSITTYPISKYYDSYTYNDSYTTYTRGRLGDATVEMAPTGTRGNWYSDSAGFPYSSGPWFMRGCSYSDGTNAGAFSFVNITGGASHSYSFRVSLGAQASLGALD